MTARRSARSFINKRSWREEEKPRRATGGWIKIVQERKRCARALLLKGNRLCTHVVQKGTSYYFRISSDTSLTHAQRILRECFFHKSALSKYFTCATFFPVLITFFNIVATSLFCALRVVVTLAGAEERIGGGGAGVVVFALTANSTLSHSDLSVLLYTSSLIKLRLT